MDAISPVFRVKSSAELRPIRLFQDWEIDEAQGTAFYRPKGLLFLIAASGPCPVPIDALTAQLAHSCEPVQLPDVATLANLGRDALHAFYLVASICQEPDDEPPF